MSANCRGTSAQISYSQKRIEKQKSKLKYLLTVEEPMTGFLISNRDLQTEIVNRNFADCRGTSAQNYYFQKILAKQKSELKCLLIAGEPLPKFLIFKKYLQNKN